MWNSRGYAPRQMLPVCVTVAVAQNDLGDLCRQAQSQRFDEMPAMQERRRQTMAKRHDESACTNQYGTTRSCELRAKRNSIVYRPTHKAVERRMSPPKWLPRWRVDLLEMRIVLVVTTSAASTLRCAKLPPPNEALSSALAPAALRCAQLQPLRKSRRPQLRKLWHVRRTNTIRLLRF